MSDREANIGRRESFGDGFYGARFHNEFVVLFFDRHRRLDTGVGTQGRLAGAKHGVWRVPERIYSVSCDHPNGGGHISNNGSVDDLIFCIPIAV